MFVLLANKTYKIEGVKMKFLETIKNGEVSVFDANGIRIKISTSCLMKMSIKNID